MPKVVQRPPYPAPPIEDFIRTHGGAEAVTHNKAREILGVSGSATIYRMIDDGRLYASPCGRVMMRSIYDYLFGPRKRMRVVGGGKC